MADNLREHVTTRATWLRLLYMVLFIIAFNVAELVISIVVLVQFLFKLFTGGPLEQLVILGDSLSSYIAEIVQFLTFRTEDMPYPFSKWPKGTSGAKTSTRKNARKRTASGTTRRRRSATNALESSTDEPVGETPPTPS